MAAAPSYIFLGTSPSTGTRVPGVVVEVEDELDKLRKTYGPKYERVVEVKGVPHVVDEEQYATAVSVGIGMAIPDGDVTGA